MRIIPIEIRLICIKIPPLHFKNRYHVNLPYAGYLGQKQILTTDVRDPRVLE